jgi:predicted MPP superfamily phosphohydrolase
MKTTALILFFSIFFIINGLISFYIYTRGLQAIAPDSRYRSAYSVVFWIIALSFIGGRIFERILPSQAAEFLIGIGSIWLGAMLYFFLIVVFFDLLRLGNHLLPFFPAVITNNYAKTKSIAAMSAMGLVAVLLLGGYINATIPRIKNLNLFIPKKPISIKSLNIVMVSDIHLGTMISRSRIDTIVSKINALNPDIVLLPGDIIDEDPAPVIKKNLGEAIKNIRSRFGTYAVTGNHEFIGGVEEACAYLTAHGVTMLRDRSIKIGDSFFIVGREDRSVGRTGHKRKGLDELMIAVDTKLPVILMDHQPFGLEEAVHQGIDLQLSGHTHYGQLWPLNYIVNSIYEISWGYKRIGKTHFYISSGVGTWGPPMRIGNHPEIVHIQLNFQ